MRIAFLAALLLLSLTTAPASAQRLTVADVLTRVVVDGDLAGGVVVVRDGADVTRYAAGYSDVETKAGFAPNTHIRAASITKTFVAATILQLVAEGRIDLDASVETYLPGRVRGEGIDPNAITVRQLLRHQSGLPEYFDKDTLPPTEPKTPDQLLDMALARPAQFPPGAKMEYTNTNYIIAGMILEKVTGRPAVDEITWRTIVPFGLFDTYFPAPGDTGLREPYARGYEVKDGRRSDVTVFQASAAGMSGELISTNEDTSAFITALLDGRVVPRAQLDEMMDVVEMPDGDGLFDYGLGLMKVNLPCGVTAWGHGGDILGYHSFMAKPFDGPAVSMTFTQSPNAASPKSDPRVAVLDAIYC
ncbi:serine hydrolase domain-containing protein [Mycolicibacterium elephantis]|uniref:serine hydrolase domain-containing protein n=1 Tax=Mycolicibacterium elephantis TaxID=81858 RepID=UPI003A8466B7